MTFTTQPVLRSFILATLLLTLNHVSFGEDELTCNRWEVLDLKFSYKGKLSDPFTLNFGAMFSHQGGTSVSIPGFYNGDNEWIIRFCPSLEGQWNYETFSSEPKLAGKIGNLVVNPKSKLDEHGPIALSGKNPQKFVYADGSPYVLLAYELDWLFALDWDNDEDIPKTREMISHLSENKFNHVVMNVYAYDASWGEREKIDSMYNFAQPAVFPFGGSNESPDYSTLNIDFFKHLDRVIAHLDEQEIIAHLMIYVWNKKVNWPEADSRADNMYFDYVVKRYQAFPNLIWDISKEALAYGREDMHYITARIDRLRGLDGHDRLVTVHDYAYCDAYPGKVDFISIQNWRPNLYDVMLEVKNKHMHHPIFNIEHGGYEKSMHRIFKGAYDDAVACLDRNYQCMFAGSYSTYYWQNTAWYEVIYEPDALAAEDQPKLAYYRHLSSLFRAFDFNELEPDASISNTFCLTDHDQSYLFYIPDDMIALQGDFAELKDKEVKIKWFDPFTGQFHGSEIHRFDNGTWKSFSKNSNVSSPFCVAVLEVITKD